MFQLQYWHESLAEWRDAGVRSADRDVVARRMRDDRAACGGCVRFRIHEVDVLASLSDFEYECATVPV